MSGGQLGSRRPTRQRNTLLPREPLRWMGRRALWLDRRAAPVAMVTLGWESELPLRSNQMWPYYAFGFPVSCPMPAGRGLDGRAIGPGAWAPSTLMPRPTGRLLKEARQ